MAFPSAWALVLLIRGEAGWGKRIQGNNYHNASTKVLSFLADLISPHRPSSLTNDPKYHPLIRTLCEAARDLDPELKFTSIQVNKDSKYGLHCDSSNLGLSGFLGLGNFTGGWSYLGSICRSARIQVICTYTRQCTGQLWVHDSACVSHVRGCRCRFRDVQNKFQRFDGNKPHFTCKFLGER